MVSILTLDHVNIETDVNINMQIKIATENVQEKIVQRDTEDYTSTVNSRHKAKCEFRHEDTRHANVASDSKIDKLSRTVKLMQNNIVGLENKNTTLESIPKKLESNISSWLKINLKTKLKKLNPSE